MEVTAGAGERWIDRAARFIDEARRRRGSMERLADRLSRYFLPVAALAGLATFFVWLPDRGAFEALLHSLAVLLVACPCALGLATPLAVLGALDAAARDGILIRGGEAIEGLARVRSVVFDKTGTLTQGSLKVARAIPARGVSSAELLAVAGALARSSVHPASRAIAFEAGRLEVRTPAVSDGRAHAGLGVSGRIGADRALLGSRRFIETELGKTIGDIDESNGSGGHPIVDASGCPFYDAEPREVLDRAPSPFAGS